MNLELANRILDFHILLSLDSQYHQPRVRAISKPVLSKKFQNFGELLSPLKSPSFLGNSRDLSFNENSRIFNQIQQKRVPKAVQRSMISLLHQQSLLLEKSLIKDRQTRHTSKSPSNCESSIKPKQVFHNKTIIQPKFSIGTGNKPLEKKEVSKTRQLSSSRANSSSRISSTTTSRIKPVGLNEKRQMQLSKSRLKKFL